MAFSVTAAADGNDTAPPSIARIRDYWLGGSHNRESDRVFADRTAVCVPHVPYLVRAQRTLLRRMVRYLIGQGIRQFLDLGSGVPALGHVHEIARRVEPLTRVVYVDNDPGVAAEGRALLTGTDNAEYLHADVRLPDTVLRQVSLLDLAAPVALLAIDTMQHIPDEQDPQAILRGYLAAFCPGSFLGLSHYGPDDQLVNGFGLFDQMGFGPRPQVSLRDRQALEPFFAGLDLVPPGIVPVPLWRPDPEDDDQVRNPERVPINAALARKP
ncbi:SAM-dependent methyltransferase [Actinophytocola sp.]|uniref:SAM-dependent methyltransferase n=1 Tax=Actinophytocola sp. TaxID=1872138 RepID=UPI002D7F5E83|nr:SAM-dependent methyltransferase [Actinophytocola sp.]HET9142825.1 SAM-dependent methyltransferase [Actinophytocola sp.]